MNWLFALFYISHHSCLHYETQSGCMLSSVCCACSAASSARVLLSSRNSLPHLPMSKFSSLFKDHRLCSSSRQPPKVAQLDVSSSEPLCLCMVFLYFPCVHALC